MKQKIHFDIRLSGLVQGVGFRYFIKNEARKLNIYGFVQNDSNRDVYIEAEGESSNLETFLECCKQGPPPSSVTKMDTTQSQLKNFSKFEIK